MQGMESTSVSRDERIRSETMIESLACIQPKGETVAELAHDARNLVTALALYCELLEAPDVLNPACRHYGRELRMVAEGSRRLLDRMLVLERQPTLARTASSHTPVTLDARREGSIDVPPIERWPFPITPDTATSPANVPDSSEDTLNTHIADIREELLANRNVLSALAGPSVALSMSLCGGALPVRLSGEELTRVLVNLVKNASEAIKGVGAIRISLGERRGKGPRRDAVVLSVEDSGSGIASENLERIFESGFSTRTAHADPNAWTQRHRGLGLSIARSIIEAAGGSIQAENRVEGGARFEIYLPVSPQRPA